MSDAGKTYTEVLMEELEGLTVLPEDIHHAIRRAKKRVSARFDCAHCGKDCHEWYMVKNAIWRLAMYTHTGILHLKCLEQLIGRPVTIDDLSPAEINDVVRYFLKPKEEVAQEAPDFTERTTNVELRKDYTQVVVYRATTVEPGEIEAFERWVEKSLKARCQYLENVTRGGQHEALFAVHDADVRGEFTTRRLQYGMSWLEDVMAGGPQYPERIRRYQCWKTGDEEE